MVRRPGQGCLGVAPMHGTDESFFISKHRDSLHIMSQRNRDDNWEELGVERVILTSSVNIAVYEL